LYIASAYNLACSLMSWQHIALQGGNSRPCNFRFGAARGFQNARAIVAEACAIHLVIARAKVGAALYALQKAFLAFTGIRIAIWRF